MNDSSSFSQKMSQMVVWGDMDAFRHVNNVMYFRYMESARVEYFSKIGYMRGKIGDTSNDVGPILAEANCKFIKALEYPDTVEVCTRVSRIGRTSVIMEQAIISPKIGLAATGTAVVVCYDYEKEEKVPVPENIRQAIERLEGKTF